MLSKQPIVLEREENCIDIITYNLCVKCREDASMITDVITNVENIISRTTVTVNNPICMDLKLFYTTDINNIQNHNIALVFEVQQRDRHVFNYMCN